MVVSRILPEIYAGQRYGRPKEPESNRQELGEPSFLAAKGTFATPAAYAFRHFAGGLRIDRQSGVSLPAVRR